MGIVGAPRACAALILRRDEADAPNNAVGWLFVSRHFDKMHRVVMVARAEYQAVDVIVKEANMQTVC